MNRDPVGYMGGANPYEYVSDGPTGKSDPLGTLDFEWWGALAACAGVLDSLLAGQDGDPCNNNYNLCMDIGDCIDEAIATAVKGLFAETLFLAGCMEGITSGITHLITEWVCQSLFKPCDHINPGCAIEGVVMDTIIGCTDGLLGNTVKIFGEGVTQLVDMVFEYFMSLLGMRAELSCDAAFG